MDKTKKILLQMLLLILVVVAILFYWAHKENKKLEQRINQITLNIQKENPEFIQENNLKKGFFKSSGVYKIKSNDENFPFEMVTNYHLKHGLSYILNKEIKFDSLSELKSKEIEIKNPEGSHYIKNDGVIYANGNLLINNYEAIVKMSASKGYANMQDTIVLGKGKTFLDFNRNEGLVEAHIISKETLANNKKINTLTDGKIKYSFNLETMFPSNFDMKIKEYKADLYILNDIDFKFDIKHKDYKYDMEGKLSLGNIKSRMLKENLSFSTDIEIKGVDEKAFKKENVKKLNFKDTFINGALLDIKKMEVKVKETNDKLNIKYKLRVKPENDIAKIKPSAQTDLSILVLTEGIFTDKVIPVYEKLELVDETLSLNNAKELQVSLDYKEQKVFLNGKEKQDGYLVDILKEYFERLDRIVLSNN